MTKTRCATAVPPERAQNIHRHKLRGGMGGEICFKHTHTDRSLPGLKPS